MGAYWPEVYILGKGESLYTTTSVLVGCCAGLCMLTRVYTDVSDQGHKGYLEHMEIFQTVSLPFLHFNNILYGDISCSIYKESKANEYNFRCNEFVGFTP